MAIFGHLTKYIDHVYDEDEYENVFESHKIGKSYGILFFYFFIIPIAIYFIMNYMVDHNLSYPKILGVYGYSFTIFIPVSFLFMIPTDMLRWLFLIGASAISLAILFKELVLAYREVAVMFLQKYIVAVPVLFMHLIFI